MNAKLIAAAIVIIGLAACSPDIMPESSTAPSDPAVSSASAQPVDGQQVALGDSPAAAPVAEQAKKSEDTPAAVKPAKDDGAAPALEPAKDEDTAPAVEPAKDEGTAPAVEPAKVEAGKQAD